jgi:hypothetical protein
MCLKNKIMPSIQTDRSFGRITEVNQKPYTKRTPFWNIFYTEMLLEIALVYLIKTLQTG